MPTPTLAGPCLALALAALLCPAVRAAAPPSASRGESIYRTQCAACHGPRGEGGKGYKKPLEGDRSVHQLAKLIRETMPEDNPESLSESDANAVAAFVHDGFYSRAVRERLRPVRVELARLTVKQYRSAVSDLVGSFRPAFTLGEKRGLAAEYFKGRNFRGQNRVLQRTDAQVAFDFGTNPPADKIPHHEFMIRWAGSVVAEQTGEYEFVVRTEHAARLWLNDTKRPLIDAWVKSGSDTEYRANIFLVAGRAYPLRLEYAKAKQGVDDSAKNKGKEPPRVKSSMTLLWKPPGRAAEPVPNHNLIPTAASESYVCGTPFPPDDRSYGWERGTTVSKEWHEAATEAAFDAADYVAARIDVLANTREGDPKRKEKHLDFCRRFAERAFRRPLDENQKKHIDRQFMAGKDSQTAVKRVLIAALTSPRFLYREAAADADPHATAARLSFGLWDSVPDAALLTAAAAGKLATKEQVAAQAERMLADPRGHVKLRDFLLAWVRADQPHDISRDAKKFPGFDAHVADDLRSSLELFFDDVVWSESSDFRQLLLSDQLPLNGRLAKFYGADPPKDGFQKVKLDDGKRAGVLTHPYLMARYAHSDTSSPIHRGVFVARGVLGVALKAPPEAVTPLAPDLHPKLSTRERVILQTKPTNCITCHAVINPLGFALENFDAVGRFRMKEKDRDIDAAGSYQTHQGKVAKFAGAREMAAFLADSPEAQSAFVEKLFHHLAQQSARAYGPDTVERLRRSFAANKFHVRKLAVEILTVAALQGSGNRAQE